MHESAVPRRGVVNDGTFARAFGVRSWRVGSDAAFEAALREAVDANEPAVIEVLPGDTGP